MSRNHVFLRSVIFSGVTKIFGFFVVFACLPLAALSLSTAEFAMFNYSMTITTIFSILFGPVGALLIGRYARLASLEDCDAIRKLAESSIAVFVLLGALVLPLALGAGFFLTPVQFRTSFALATVGVVVTNILSWAEAFRLGLRRDHITSTFMLGSNVSIISLFFILYRFDHLSYGGVMVVYYLSPLLWSLLSFLQATASRRIIIRARVPFGELKEIMSGIIPILAGNVAEYIRLNVSLIVAFYLYTPQGYGLYSTVILLIARVTNPMTLLSRPLIPAYVDAITHRDHRWITKLRWAMAAIVALFVLSFLVVAVAAFVYPFQELRFGAINVEKYLVRPYLVFGMLLLVSALLLALLSAIYLGAQQMKVYSRVSVIANFTAVVVGASVTQATGMVGLLAAIAVCNCLSAAYLFVHFFRDCFQREHHLLGAAHKPV